MKNLKRYLVVAAIVLFAGGAVEVVADAVDGGGACADHEGEGVPVAGKGDVTFVDGEGGLLGEAERLGEGLIRGGGAPDNEEEEGDGGGRGENGEEGSHDGVRASWFGRGGGRWRD